ncbi:MULTISPECIES: poly-beta-1,6-N-acetyl-D-glucosamine biosynthesis protein PgaD [unclassified Clostridium]|uniref:poly-beta-1,6-N-acetyl-D-glucosamine biosynthesis protein PgaD n=1 Tax=unclassified Clostridium TaxID=2614128 RepID=UPI0002985BDD|nr:MULTISPECIES: poly-beta-1,6-N-acetyl-D-glucosamine biosynthesis protein PgaD [unclassified Clostridium]EKQ54363.1 MAG: poly-beta-1,6-N-acetyl-D-glucosamine biosynthesis protein PgaD [Clostridium sp. Maddingley MBC34-26]
MNIIDGLQKKGIRILEILITTVGWLIMLYYIIQTLSSMIFLSLLYIVFWSFNLPNFYNKLFTLSDVSITMYTFMITIVIASSSFILIYFWGKYNYKRYAHLRRRKFPKAVTEEEIERYFNLPSSTIEKMQNDKIIILDKTIV